MSRKIALLATIATLTTRIAADTAKLAATQSQVDQFDLIEGIDVGTNVSFLIGRAETRKEVVGRVTAVKSETVGEGEAAVTSRKFKVEYTPTGDAFDSTFGVIAESQVLAVVVDEGEEVVCPEPTPEFDAE
jgi:hypothetical protein